MTVVDEHFRLFSDFFQGALMQGLPGGANLVVCQNVELPPGWNRHQSTIKFVAPVGYPLSKPDCFWADADLRLVNGAMPKATGFNAIPGVQQKHLWFSWHVSQWNPHRDSLLSFFMTIQARLQTAQ